jgi:AAT family amino acid transporter
VNATSVRFFGVVEYIFSALKVTAISAFLILGGYIVLHARHVKDPSIGLRNYVAHGGFLPHGVWGMWVAVLVSLFSYFSIEMIAIAAGEAEDPKRAIQHAFRATMLRLALFYLGTLALVLALAPWTITAAGAAQSPFVTVMQQTHLPAAAGVVNFVILVAALSAMNSQLYITARMLFSLSRSGLAPEAFGKLSRNGVPIQALLVSTLGIGVAAVLNAWYRERAFQLMLSLSIFGPMFTWLMVFVTHLFFRRHWRGRKLHFRMWGYPFTSILGIVFMSGTLITTLFTPAFRPTLIYGTPFLVLLSIGYFVSQRRGEAATKTTVEEF